MTEFKDCYLLPVIPRVQRPFFPEFDVDGKKHSFVMKKRQKMYIFWSNMIEAYFILIVIK